MHLNVMKNYKYSNYKTMYIMQPTTILDTIVIKIFMQCIK